MNKNFIETYKQLDVFSEDMYQGNYGPLVLDLGFYHDTFALKIIDNLDWEGPLEDVCFRSKDDYQAYDNVLDIDLKNIKKYLNLYKKKIINGEYDNNYIYKFDAFAKHISCTQIKYIYEYCLGYEKCSIEDEEREVYKIIGKVLKSFKSDYFSSDFEIIGDIDGCNYIIDLMNEYITYGDEKTQKLIAVGFIEGLGVQERHIEKVQKVLRHQNLQKHIKVIK